MSVKVMSRVWDHSKQKNSKLLLLVAIADSANDDGFAWPSEATLAKKMRMTKRNVQKLIDALQDAGEIVVYNRINEQNPEQHYSNVYQVPMPGVHEIPAELKGIIRKRGNVIPDTGVVSNSTLPNVIPDTGVVSNSPPEPLLEPSPETSGDTSPTPHSVTPASSAQRKRIDTRAEKAKDALPFTADETAVTPRDYKDVPYDARYGIIQAWCSNLKKQPVGAFNEKLPKGRLNHLTAAELIRAGYTESQVEAYVRHTQQDAYWRDKTLTLQKVSELLPGWLATYKPPVSIEAQNAAIHEQAAKFAAEPPPSATEWMRTEGVA